MRDRCLDLAGRHVLHVGAGEGARDGGAHSPAARSSRPSSPTRSSSPRRGPASRRRPGSSRRSTRSRSSSGAAASTSSLADHTLARIGDLHAWAHGLEAALRSGGYLLLHDEHPLLRVVDPLLHWRGRYEDGPTVGTVVTALARAGLVVRRVEELPAPRPGTASRASCWSSRASRSGSAAPGTRRPSVSAAM